MRVVKNSINLPAAETAGYTKNDTIILSFPDLIGESRKNTKSWIVGSSRTMTDIETQGNSIVPKAFGMGY